MSVSNTKQRRTKRIVIILSIGVVGMFFFGYALVPLYNVLCNVLGINGKTTNASIANHSLVDKSRYVTVLFVANTNAHLPWQFKSLVKKIEIHPGQNAKVAYYAKNLSDHAMTVQAVPSVSPGLAAQYLKKTECFCFTQQTLAAHQGMDMPLIFHVTPELPKKIHTITLSYTLFKSIKKVPKSRQGRL